MLELVKKWLRRRKYREGRVVTQFVAKDVRRDVLVVSVEKLDHGMIVCRIRTNNLLYLAGRLVEEAEYGPEVEISIDELWHWTGKSWGGLPSGKSIVEQTLEKN